MCILNVFLCIFWRVLKRGSVIFQATQEQFLRLIDKTGEESVRVNCLNAVGLKSSGGKVRLAVNRQNFRRPCFFQPRSVRLMVLEKITHWVYLFCA